MDERDKTGGRSRSQKNYLETVIESCETWQLVDIYGCSKTQRVKDTLGGKNPEVQCTLDFFLDSQGLI